MATTSKGSVVTRNSTDIWLVGQISSSLNQTKLPSKREILSIFFHYKNQLNLNIRDSAHCTAADVLIVWEKANIPTRLKKHVVDKIEGLFKEWQKLKKNKENKSKRSEGLQQKEEEWKLALEDLFDIAHANALNMIKIEEDKEFLLSQRQKGRPGKLGSLDKQFVKKEAESLKKKERFQQLKEREEAHRKMLFEKTSIPSDALADELSSTDSETCSNQEEEASCSFSDPPKKRGRLNILDNSVAASLDAAKLSDRKAAIVLTTTLKSVGCDPAEYNVNKSSIRRLRIKSRASRAQDLKVKFSASVPLTVHWDGKILEDISGSETVDRLPIILSGKGIDQLLGVPKLQVGTGEAIASAVHETLEAWGITEQVKCMSFDTTSVNTGLSRGACVLLEQKLGKEMLWLACRHHIFEIMLEAVVVKSLGVSSGPDILLFKRFKTSWSSIDRTFYQTSINDPSIDQKIKDNALEIIEFSQNQLNDFQPRDDYKELLELAIVFLGDVPKRGVHFRAPAGLHRARWMAKAIYSIKIYLFRDQFNLSKQEEAGIRQVCSFVVKIYIHSWFQAQSACSASRNDLLLLKSLKEYENVNKDISTCALKKFLGHLWYLSEELVAFGFFDDKVSLETKRNMVLALKNEESDEPLKRARIDPEVILQKNLQDFVSGNTLRFFEILNLPSDFLETDVSTWSENESYKTCKSLVTSIKVVNDVAERGVALMEEYNKLHTKDEEQKQYLLLLVKQFRSKYPDSKKSTLLS